MTDLSSLLPSGPGGASAGASAAALAFAAGLLLGAFHFGSLWWNARAFAEGAWLRAAALQILRFAVLLAALGALAVQGALPLLAGGLGLVVMRPVATRLAGGTSWTRR
ncbi:ATP synthase subunit I [Propylenella binzhouense]|uniref:ATP synthase subunit I n=1 Tax=Propylenella binzhouense TaxID=2555902 RepID=A0A964WUC3_9HYPH|nr:ATP synthase subunit I [Propylenella binzhouense]MYZ48967.1 ATP synthase subunit I [Propylenella binzhouense]